MRNPEVGRDSGCLSYKDREEGFFPFCFQEKKKKKNYLHGRGSWHSCLSGVTFCKHPSPLCEMLFALWRSAAVYAEICMRWKMHVCRFTELACKAGSISPCSLVPDRTSPFHCWKLRHSKTRSQITSQSVQALCFALQTEHSHPACLSGSCKMPCYPSRLQS